MRRLWTTAAAAALCVFAADAWGAPYGGRLDLVAIHHHARTETTQTSSHRRRHKSEETASETRHSRRSRHGLRGESAEEAPAHGRRGRRHAEEIASREETHAHGRRSRHHAEEEVRVRRGRHHAEEVTREESRTRHGRRVRRESEIRTEHGAFVQVRRHDTLEAISRDTGVTIPELVRLNHLRRPYRIHPGQALKLPERRYYVVKSGETLYSIGRKFGLEPSELADFNDLKHGRSLRAGQKLYLPNEAEEAAPPEEEQAPPRKRERPAHRLGPRYAPPSVEPTFPPPAERPYARPAPTYAPPPQGPTAPPSSPSVSTPPPPQPSAPASSSQGFALTSPPRPQPYQPPPGRSIIQSSPSPSASDVATAGRGRFIWPVNGQVIQAFGPKADGQRNDGLNIAGNPGDPVRAAADGEVVYAGNQVPSFGNLVLIKHQGGWVTAYADMGRILVHNRDQVVQGQEIGVVGQTGSVTSPQLHFEIRYAPSPRDKAQPVDPTLVLPQK